MTTSIYNFNKIAVRNSQPYFQLSNEQLDKIGNTMIFLSKAIPNLSKTKLLKLLYILDEFSISKSGIPFFNLQYKVWKLGPVTEEVFVELSDKPVRFEKYVDVILENGGTYIYPKSDFCDDEFSDNDLELLYDLSIRFKDTPAKELIEYTHRPNSPWRNTAEESGVYELLEKGEITNTEIIVNMGYLVSHDERKKNIFEHYIEEKQ